jgi:hypothetical protein
MLNAILDWWSLYWILIDDLTCYILIDDHPSDFPYINNAS